MEHKEALVENRMILLGAAGRNLGKTELAVRLIAQYAKTTAVVGVKVVTISNHSDVCPRGGHGCGICSGFNGSYEIKEELEFGLKDTQKFLTAGANVSFLVRTTKDGLLDALTDLLSRIPEKAVIVCESNQVRTVLKPGCFIMLESSDNTRKPSASLVWNLADRIIKATEDEFRGVLLSQLIF